MKRNDVDALYERAVQKAIDELPLPTLAASGECITINPPIFTEDGEAMAFFGPIGIEPIWHPYPEEKPKEAGEYLVAQDCEGAIYYSIASFGKSWWVQESQRNIKAKKHGRYWYKYDSEWGDYTCDNVIAWMPIPKYEKAEDNG